MKKEFEVGKKKFTMEVVESKKDDKKESPYIFYTIITKGENYEDKIEVAEKHLLIQIKEEEKKVVHFVHDSRIDMNEKLKKMGFK